MGAAHVQSHSEPQADLMSALLTESHGLWFQLPSLGALDFHSGGISLSKGEKELLKTLSREENTGSMALKYLQVVSVKYYYGDEKRLFKRGKKILRPSPLTPTYYFFLCLE